MSNALDPITHRPIGQWRLSPPEIIIAENGFVLRTYDVMSDQNRYAVATDADAVRAELNKWADAVAADIKRAVERELAKV